MGRSLAGAIGTRAGRELRTPMPVFSADDLIRLLRDRPELWFPDNLLLLQEYFPVEDVLICVSDVLPEEGENTWKQKRNWKLSRLHEHLALIPLNVSSITWSPRSIVLGLLHEKE
jgi:hypothetical protein